MKLQAFLPLVTHPDPNSEAVAENAVAVAEWLGATLHARASTPTYRFPPAPCRAS